MRSRVNSNHKRSRAVLESKRGREVVKYVRMAAVEGNLKSVDCAGCWSRAAYYADAVAETVRNLLKCLQNGMKVKVESIDAVIKYKRGSNGGQE